MTKKEAMKVRVGETILNKHRRRLETVGKIITEHPDPKARVPLFVTICFPSGAATTLGMHGSSYLLFQRV